MELSGRARTTSGAITLWFHTVNYCNFTPAQFVGIVIRLFKSSLRLFHLHLDVQDAVFRKAMVDAVCTFYHSKQTHRSISGPLRNFTVPLNWSNVCEECWQDVLVHTFFTIEYWDDFWRQSDFGTMPDLFYDIQPFLTAVLPLYVRRSTALLESEHYIVLDEGNKYMRFEAQDADNEEDDGDAYYIKTKKQKKLQNDAGY